MTDDLDLRALRRRHEPDPRFVAGLGTRLEEILADPASAGRSADVVTIDLEQAESQPRRARRHSRRVIRSAVLVAAASVAAIALVLSRDDASVDETTVVDGGPEPNGWVALDSEGDIYLVRQGQDARRLDIAGSDGADESCPTWSPDGERLSFGRVTASSDAAASEAELVIVPVGSDGVVGASKVIALDGFYALPGFVPHPCATWAPDGRWVALAGSGEVWVADTHTGTIRRLPDLRPTDLAWRPGTDELAIAGDIGPNREANFLATPVTVYSVSTDELRRLGSVRAARLTWSPDGSTLAFQGGEHDDDGLRLVDADGTNERLLTRVGSSNHGVGPVWSPSGERIAYQRLCCAGAETHEVVLVDVADGSETVIAPPETGGTTGREIWYPFSVTWAPDGTTLLYNAWSQVVEGHVGSASSGTLAVRADTPTDVIVLTKDLSLTGVVYDHPWVHEQMWGRHPG